MSGALSDLGSIGSIAQGEGVAALSSLGGVGGLLGNAFGSILSEASWRGVSFYMPSSQDSAGRRLIQIWFPGVDAWRAQDLGAQDGQIRVRGLIIGDDYVIRAKRMRAALLARGPATLVHPWWGSLRCRLVEPGTISFAENEIRVARFEATFQREPTTSVSTGLFSQIASTVENVLTTADALVDQAALITRAVLSPLSLGVALAASVSSVVSQVSAVWDALFGSAPVAVQSVGTTERAALADGVSVPIANPDNTFADSVTTLLSGVPAALANAAMPADTSAVAAATLVSGDVSDDVTATQATSILLSGVTSIRTAIGSDTSAAVQSGAVQALGLVACVVTLAQAMATQTDQDYASQTDAAAARDTMVAAIDALQSQIVSVSAVAAIPVSGLSDAVLNARMAVVADISDRIGRLPALVTVSLGRPVDAWALAYAVAGDVSGDVASVWDDLITRNAAIHPALIGPGDVAVLEVLS
ncbi:DNA circularization N-terminal domain-containing protein [Acetobacter sicerae]|uniref:DNA circularization N-terminal domain-containing protein n=1 Tax=Acetobacter sicerae TaxID=85325 RepID=A0ABS8VXL4_9PROT|nr:DNA circularization N-terminal domain-containing protein [Acetobacter sicerae]MCE0744601.1 DNA circularization N-terminal domain-containing protein [Acetobacter sicerae]